MNDCSENATPAANGKTCASKDVDTGPKMDKKEAQKLLDLFVAALQSRSYREWQELLGESQVMEKTGLSGVTYQIEWEAFWDAQAGGDIRVMVSIDDGSLARSIVPLTASFLVFPHSRIS